MDWANPTTQVAIGFGLALAIGVLVGLERERRATEDKRASFGGIRTFPMIGLLGAVGGLLSQSWGALALLAFFGGVATLVSISYWMGRTHSDGQDPGLTSEVAALVVFALGALPFFEHAGLDFKQRCTLAGALGTVVLLLLSMKEPLHKVAGQVSREDLYAAVRFLVLAAIILPLLPDQDYLDWAALNPFSVGVVVVLVAGISFVGYLAVRFFGARKGIGLTALFGGLASSTAVALSFSARGKEHPKLAPMCAFAIVLASTVMFPRITVVLSAMNPELFQPVLASLGTMCAFGVAGGFVLWFRAGREKHDGDEPKFANPFELSQALKLGLVYVAVRLVSSGAHNFFGDAGLYVSAVLAGLTDVDAITISVARLHASNPDLTTESAVLAITLAAISNTMVKSGIALALGGKKVGFAVAAVLVPAAIAGLVVSLLT